MGAAQPAEDVQWLAQAPTRHATIEETRRVGTREVVEDGLSKLGRAARGRARIIAAGSALAAGVAIGAVEGAAEVAHLVGVAPRDLVRMAARAATEAAERQGAVAAERVEQQLAMLHSR